MCAWLSQKTKHQNKITRKKINFCMNQVYVDTKHDFNIYNVIYNYNIAHCSLENYSKICCRIVILKYRKYIFHCIISSLRTTRITNHYMPELTIILSSECMHIGTTIDKQMYYGDAINWNKKFHFEHELLNRF